MERPNKTESLERTRERLIFHEAQLGADDLEEIRGLAEPTARLMERVDEFLTERRKSGDESIRKMAMRERRTVGLDQVWREFDLAVLGLTKRDREDARYIQIYGKLTLSGVLRLSAEEKVKVSLEAVSSLGEAKFEAIKTPWQERLTVAATALGDAHRALVGALEARESFNTKGTLLRMDVLDLLNRNYADILQHFPNQKAVVNSFFATFEAPKKKGKTQEDP